MIRCVIACFLILCSAAANATMEGRTTEQYLKDSTLIAILQVGKVHQQFTPEEILVQSATATIEKIVYNEHTGILESGTLRKLEKNDTITLYAVFPDCENVGDEYYPRIVENSILMLKEGRVFAILKQQGINDFTTFDRFSIQKLDKDEMIHWPLENSHEPNKIGHTELLPLSSVIERIDKMKGAPSVETIRSILHEADWCYTAALKSYEQVLSLDPKNAYAQKFVKYLKDLPSTYPNGDFMTEHEKKIRGEEPTKETHSVKPQ